jgi:phage shock protein A
MDSSDVVFKFDELENRIERMESEADLVNYGRKTTLEEEMENLTADDDIEKELKALKDSKAKKEQPADSA